MVRRRVKNEFFERSIHSRTRCDILPARASSTPSGIVMWIEHQTAGSATATDLHDRETWAKVNGLGLWNLRSGRWVAVFEPTDCMKISEMSSGGKRLAGENNVSKHRMHSRSSSSFFKSAACEWRECSTMASSFISMLRRVPIKSLAFPEVIFIPPEFSVAKDAEMKRER